MLYVVASSSPPIHTSSMQIFCVHETCEAVWEQVKILYANKYNVYIGFAQTS